MRSSPLSRLLPALAAALAVVLAAWAIPSAALGSDIDDLNRLVRNGDADAQYELAIRYDTSDGVPHDAEESFRLYTLAANQGHVQAQYNLGVAYDTGDGCPVDHYEANVWYRKAADQGYADAQYNLGISYLQGEGIAQSTSQAKQWLRKAANQGHQEASEVLSSID
jgi:TPR repeat protein